MRKADRLFETIEILRRHGRPVTADHIAAEIGVSVRTVYRDIAGLQADGVPIEGEAGIGYVLHAGYHLPPLMLTTEEVEAVVIGAKLAGRYGDKALIRAAESLLAKVRTVLPEDVRADMEATAYFAAPIDDRLAGPIDLTLIRGAIRGQEKVTIAYINEKGERSERTIWPIALVFFGNSAVLGAWCEMRRSFRNFRPDRMVSQSLVGARYPGRRDDLVRRWFEEASRERRAACPDEGASLA
ncbi:helix-turn-helix transcriptional regulator [Gimibacter soli]|uniref:YafY family protein n=1 Tax=Gimibacter soli TaxID=3024400 RepID=A0AAE9XRN0_9PROT|nr:YafY family protein [Gimibacter soli]WCL53665.1 YafY family protein [Gimibacter soli]